MNKRFIILLVIAVLGGAATYFIVTKDKNKLNNADWRNFAVEDTASVTKIFLADRQGHQVTIERKSPTAWIVNKKFDARRDVIKVLLQTIKTVHTKSPVPKNARENVMKKLSAKGVKIEIYTKDEDEPVKVYYVGGEVPNNDIGTYMMQECSPEPFITEILGFEGYLTPRYSPLEQVWKDPALFRISPEEIATVKFTNYETPQESFEVINKGKYDVEVKDANGQPIPAVDKITAQKYLGHFGQLVYEDMIGAGIEQSRIDSVLNSPVFGNMVITAKGGKTYNLVFHRIKNIGGDLDADGKPIPWDPDRFHANLAHQKELYVFQYFVWDKAMLMGQGASFFLPKKR